jgi:pimeloyl-ACP methyl ester carboxylesterase
MAIKERNGVKLAYVEEGRGDPAFIFIHGWTCSRSYFKPQHDHFKANHRVVSVDLRGHGESDKPKAAYPISQYADDVAWLIGQLGLERPIAVGHSMGGLTVLHMAAEHPESVRAIVMVDPAPFAWPAAFVTALQNVIDSSEAGNQEPRREFIANALFLPTSPAELKQRIVDEMCSAPSHVAADAMRGLLEYDGVATAKKVTVPALHIAGTPPLNPPHMMTEWLPQVVNGWAVGGGHFNMLETPLQVNDMIEKFADQYVMRSQPAAAAAGA